MTAVPSREVTTSQVSAVTFGFYTEKEVRKLSVKRIVTPIIFDNLKNAVPGGLYDPHLGPLDAFTSCATCGQRGNCSGHFGHVELSLPVYNPLVFTTMYKLLRSTCLHCFCLKMAQKEVDKYTERLSLLAQGKLTEAAAVTTGGGKAAESAKTIVEAGEGENSNGNTLKGKPAGKAKGAAPGPPLDDARVRSGIRTAHTQQAMRECITKFLKSMPTQTCQNCQCNNPQIRRDGSAKIFQLPLPANKLTANQMRGLNIKSVLASTSVESAEVAALEEEMAAELAKEAGSKVAGDQGGAHSSPEMEGTPAITPTPSKRAQVDRWQSKLR
ncbi:hypothetical protein ABBQ38_002612 [Trebouxia sp. C0009 RCD-2024]